MFRGGLHGVAIPATAATYKYCRYTCNIRATLFTRILTDLERQRIYEFLEEDGRRDVVIRSLISRAKKHVGRIEADLKLLRQLGRKYQSAKKTARSKSRRR
jgi:hypothetical protein